MVRFWDTSSLVALVLEEKQTARIREISREDQERAVWILSEVEAASAFWRRSRANELTDEARQAAQRSIDVVLANAVVVSDVPAVVQHARRILATHTLRAADAMQLAAALVACDDDPSRLPLVTLDDRLAEAAVREGFTVLP